MEIKNKDEVQRAVNIVIKISFIAILLIWSFGIFKPFYMVTLWGIIISVAVYPIHKKMTKILNGKNKLSAIIIVILGIVIVITPIFLFMESFVEGVESLAISLKSGVFNVLVLDAKINTIPFIGEKIGSIWHFLTDDIQILLKKIAPYLQEYVPKIMRGMAKGTIAIAQVIFSIFISGMILMNAERAKAAAQKIFKLLIGDFIEDFHEVAGETIKNVVIGVIGIAVIQATLAGVGMLAVGVPKAGIWAVLIMILAIIQLPPAILLIPIAIYVYSTSSLLVGILYIVWTIIVSILDNVLKPILMGRGVEIPMLVILIGSIGGMLRYGIIGLFVGPVILALVYKFIAVLVEKNSINN